VTFDVLDRLVSENNKFRTIYLDCQNLRLKPLISDLNISRSYHSMLVPRLETSHFSWHFNQNTPVLF